jgi:hypothetical protein
MHEVIDYDPFTGQKMTFRYDHANDQFTLGYHMDYDDLERIADRNRLERDNPTKLADNYIDHYARIPTTVIYEWLFKYGVDYNKKEDQDKWMAMLEWPEYKMWKCTNRKA